MVSTLRRRQGRILAERDGQPPASNRDPVDTCTDEFGHSDEAICIARKPYVALGANVSCLMNRHIPTGGRLTMVINELTQEWL
jgi:hypothetical protein